MRAIEKENANLKNVLPKNYASPDLDKCVLGDVVDLFTNMDMGDTEESKDLLGRTYEQRYLPTIVQGYGYKNVKEFLAEYKASKAEYDDYRKAVTGWEKLTREKVDDSLKAKLQQKQQEVKEQNRRTEHHKKNDRGARQYQKWSGKRSAFVLFSIIRSINNWWKNCIYHDIIVVFNEGEN